MTASEEGNQAESNSATAHSTNNRISPMKFAIMQILSFLINPEDLDLSYKTDLDF